MALSISFFPPLPGYFFGVVEGLWEMSVRLFGGLQYSFWDVFYPTVWISTRILKLQADLHWWVSRWYIFGSVWPVFDEMTQPQVIVQDLLHFTKRNPWWHPYSKKTYEGIRGIIQLLFARKINKKISGLLSFLKIIPGMFITGRKSSNQIK